MTGRVADPARGFGAAADAYARWRPSYPEAVYSALTDALCGPRRVCVDLGAGSGIASRQLLSHFERVVAVEPDPRMAALIPASPQLEVLIATAEEAAFAPKSIDAVVAATSFHWMDQHAVIARAADWLRCGGVFFPFLYGPFRVEGPAAATFQKHRASWAAFRDPRLGAKANYATAISESGRFSEFRSWSGSARSALAPGDAAQLLLTASYVRAFAQAGEGEAAYLQRLTSDLAAASPVIDMIFPLGGVIATRADQIEGVRSSG